MSKARRTITEHTSATRSNRRVAIVLNANARAVNERVIRDASQVVAKPADLYVSRSLEHAEFISRQLVRRRYDAVLCGGGDGTFSQLATDLAKLSPRRMPALGALRLGTGNALAGTLGAARSNRDGIAAELDRASNPAADTSLNLLSVDNRLAPFAGVGMDSLILSDYNTVRRWFKNTPLEDVMQGGPGYAAAVATRSVWRYTLGRPIVVTIRNEGAPAQKVDVRGNPIGAPVPTGEVLYHGTVSIAAASTIPYYGLGLQVFPQVASVHDRFQLRVGHLNAAAALCRLPALFRGTFSHPHVYDFMCTAVSIETTETASFQIGGDEAGERRRLDISLKQIAAIRGSALPLDRQPAVKPLQRRRVA